MPKDLLLNGDINRHTSEVSLTTLGGQDIPAPGVTDDVAYGPINIRALKGGLGEFTHVASPKAVGNADSYSWFATVSLQISSI